MKTVVTDIQWKSPQVFELSLKRQGMEFTPGDSIALFSEDGITSRPYSIASGIKEDILRFLIQRIGSISSYLAERERGDKVQLSDPFGWFHPGKNLNGTPLVFIATGTGIAPFLSYLRAYPEKPPEMLLYGVKKLEDALDLKELQTICPVRVAVSREPVSSPHCKGRVTDIISQVPLSLKPHFYLCGLDAMIDDVSASLEKSGIPFSHIHREVFFYASE